MLKEVMWMFFAVGSVPAALSSTSVSFGSGVDFYTEVACNAGRLADKMMDEYNRRFKKDIGRD